MKRVDVVYVIIFDQEEKRILMVNNVGSGWSLPGGEVEKGESLVDGAVREAREETGLTIEANTIVAVNEKFRKEIGVHAVFFTFMAKVIGGTIAINDELEISEIQWVDFKTANELMPYYPEGVEGLLSSSAPYNFQI